MTKCPKKFRKVQGLCVKKTKGGSREVYVTTTVEMRPEWNTLSQSSKDRFVDHLSHCHGLGSHDGNVEFCVEGDWSDSMVYANVKLTYPYNYSLKDIKDTVEADADKAIDDTRKYQLSRDESLMIDNVIVEG